MPEMIALRRFRHAEGQALTWLNEGDKYTVPADQVQFHVKTGRGKRVEPKQKKGE